MKKIIAAFAAGAALCLAGCASIMGDKTAIVTVSSVPPGATINIVDETGFAVFKGATPTTVNLEKSTGHYFGGKSYTVTLSLTGYQDATVNLSTHANGWYIGGNIIFGGLIGWLAVDPFNGGMYTLSPDKVNATLTQQQQQGTAGAKTSFNYTPGQLQIVLVQDVPAAMRSQLVKVGQLTRQ